MKHCLFRLFLTILLISAVSWVGYGQGTSSSLSGVVSDQSGGVVAGAEIALKNNNTGVEYKTISIENGTFVIPAVDPGTYTATITMTGFKQAILKDVKIIAATPATIKPVLQVGGTSETVTVEAGAEIVQSQSANIATTLETKQVSQLPLQSRNTIYAVLLLPGVSSPATASPRNSTINGLPSSAYNVTIDGLNTQDNLNKNGDGFFSFINPTLDAVQEVTLSTATPGAESASQGAVSVRFVTRQGNNKFSGSVYEYHRNTVLNSNYWFNNRDRSPVQDAFPHAICGVGGVPYDTNTCHAQRDRNLFNQMGGRVGGPITIPKIFNGQDKAFFFVNFEEFRQPASAARVRTIMNPLTQTGVFQYNTTVNGATVVQQVNVLTLAAANGQVSTVDPTIGKLLTDIRNSTGGGGIVQLSDPNLQSYSFSNLGIQRRYFPTVRFDFNLTSKHHLENTWNYQSYVSFPDPLNNVDPAFPGFPNQGGQESNRFSDSLTLRSTLTPRLVNEARAGLTGGTVLFFPEINAGQFTNQPIGNQAGFSLGLGAFGISSATQSTGPERRNAPIWDYSDTLTWTKGAHTLSFGGQLTQAGLFINDQTVVPSIGFGIASGDPSAGMFTTANFPGASSTNLSGAQNLYAVLTGRVTAVTASAILNETTNKYTYLGGETRRARQREFGFFGQDSWRVAPNFTLTGGVRWEVQLPFQSQNGVYTTVTTSDIYGISGVGNLFKPGVLTGKSPVLTQLKNGDTYYNTQWGNFAPSFGFAWTPKADSGVLKFIFGSNGESVFRGGYSFAYNRQASASVTGTFDPNPGLAITATKSTTLGNLVTGTGTDVLPVLLSQTSRLGAPSFPATPVYPIVPAFTDQINVFDPNMRMPYTQSWSFGLQREITKNDVIEVRYVHNINLDQWVYFNYNEVNIVENGFLTEFKNAMANLQANITSGRGTNFKYYGAGTGTAPLPIYLAYFQGLPASQATDPTKYTSPNFSSSSWYNPLAAKNPAPYTPASSSSSAGLYGSLTMRNNALAAGLPANEFVVNPDVNGGAFVYGDGGYSRYDAMQVELRRRLAHGLLLQANYTWGKGYTGNRYSFRQGWVNALSTNNGGTLRQAFKVNWVYDVPLGKGQLLLNNLNGFAGRLLNTIVGGWEMDGTGRIQTGAVINLGNVSMVGMTRRDVQAAYQIRFDDANKVVYFLPQDIIDNTIKAFSTSATSTTGYGSLGVPTGRYFAPANSNGCIQVVTGDCAGQTLFVQGPRFVRFDLSAVKRIRFNERANFELRAEFLNAFNNIDFLGNTNTGPSSSATFGQVTSAYRDSSNTQDPGGRLVQIVLRINF